MFPIRQGATHKVVVGPVVAVGDGFVPITNLDVSTADEAEVILHDNATVVDISAYTWAAIATSDGYYHLTLQSGISNTVGHMTVVVNDDSLCLPVRADFIVMDTLAYDSLYKDGAVADVNVLTMANIDFGATMKASINTEADAAIVTYKLDHLVFAAESDDPVDNSIIAKMVDAGSTADWSVFQSSEDSLRAISEKVSSIGSASGGGFNFAPLSADVLEDLIDNAAAVDKSTTPATVGIPVTGAVTAGWLAGDECTIAGSTNYEGQHVIDSVSTNEVVIVSAFTGETFASDTIKRTIKATRLVGTQTTNTFASVSGQDGVYHVIDDDANNFSISYRFAVGGGRIGTEAAFTGYLSGGNDNALIQAYNFVGSAWETRQLFDGQAGTVNQMISVPLLARNTGTSGVELGQVLIRIKQGSASSNPTLNVDSLLVEAVGVGQTAGYQQGRIYVDTNNGTAGTESYVNGTADKAVLTWADALAISAAVGITDFHIINGSTIQLSANSDNYSLFGDNWTLDLNGQSAAGAKFVGATVSGIMTGVGVSFEGGEFDSITLADDAHAIQVGLHAGTITLPAGRVTFHDCHHDASSLPIFDFGAAVGSTTMHMHNYRGGFEVYNFGDSGTDIIHLGGSGRVDINSNSSGGTLNARGAWVINDNGTTTINRDDGIAGKIFGRVNDAGATTTDFDTDGFVEASAKHFDDSTMLFISGALYGQSRPVYIYTASGQNFSFDRPWTEAPANNDKFVILPTSGNIDVWLQRAATIEANTTVLNARGVYWGQAKLFNKIAAAAGTLTIYEDDDLTALFTQALTADGAADPIIAADTV